MSDLQDSWYASLILWGHYLRYRRLLAATPQEQDERIAFALKETIHRLPAITAPLNYTTVPIRATKENSNAQNV